MMKVRITFIILAILSTIVCLFLAAMHPTGPNTVTFEQPYLFTLNIIIMVLVALPSLVLAIYDYMSFRISAILQFLGAVSWFFIIDIIAHTIYTFYISVIYNFNYFVRKHNYHISYWW